VQTAIGVAECFYRRVLRRWVRCAQMRQAFSKRRQGFAAGTGISGVRTRSVTISFSRHRRDFGKLAVSKGCSVRHAVIRLCLSRAFRRKMMPGRLSSGTVAANARSALKGPWSGSGNTARAATPTKTSIFQSPWLSRAVFQTLRKLSRKPDRLVKRCSFDPAPGHASLATLHPFCRVHRPLDHGLSS